MRITRHLKQSELADLSGVPLNCIGNYEQLRRDINHAQVCIVYRLAKALDCSIEELLDTDLLQSCIFTSKYATIAQKENFTMLKNNSGAPYGYKLIDGCLEIDKEQARNVQKIFEMYLEYTEHPPKELVERIITSSAENGNMLSYEDAEKLVPYEDILLYIETQLD